MSAEERFWNYVEKKLLEESSEVRGAPIYWSIVDGVEVVWPNTDDGMPVEAW